MVVTCVYECGFEFSNSRDVDLFPFFFVSFSSVSLVSSSKGSLAAVSLLEPLDFSASEFSRRCWFWEHFGH